MRIILGTKCAWNGTLAEYYIKKETDASLSYLSIISFFILKPKVKVGTLRELACFVARKHKSDQGVT